MEQLIFYAAFLDTYLKRKEKKKSTDLYFNLRNMEREKDKEREEREREIESIRFTSS